MTRLTGTLCLLAALTVLTALTGCSSGGDPPARDVESVDGAVALDLPEGWRASPDLADPPSVLVAEGPGQDEHLVVSLLPGEETAEQRAIEAVVGYVDSGLVDCRRLADTVIWDGPVFDCPDHTRRPWMHKVLVPIVGEGVSALLLVQAKAATFDEAVAVVRPVVGSFIWTEG